MDGLYLRFFKKIQFETATVLKQVAGRRTTQAPLPILRFLGRRSWYDEKEFYVTDGKLLQ